MSVTADDIKQKVRVKDEFEKRGHKLIRAGQDRFKTLCPFHIEKTPSCFIDEKMNVWHCQGCKAGGSVIDAVMRFDSLGVKQAIEKLSSGFPSVERQPSQPPPDKKAEIQEIYPYQDENGNDLYEVIRFIPKDFRQRHKGPNGEWIWNMTDVRRVLYRLPEVLKSKQVWVCEGEKDANNLVALGYCATCNVGGAEKWMEGYTESLEGKEVVLCGDTDDAGKKHIKMVFDSIAGKVASTRTVKLPNKFKDVSELIYSFASNAEKAKEAIEKLFNDAPVLYKGIDLPVFSMSEIEAHYINHVKSLKENTLPLSKWLPSLSCVRSIVPGEMIVILAATGTGKTALLQNLALKSHPLTTLLFELELPTSLVYERFACAAASKDGYDIENWYTDGISKHPEDFMGHIYTCPKTSIAPEELERIINQSELKIGKRPQLVLIDYIQLMSERGPSRYERTSNVAERLRQVAKETNTVIVVSSQIGRKPHSEKNLSPQCEEVTLKDGKDSGSIEGSASLVLGAWRDSGDSTLMYLRVLKNTKGQTGKLVRCNFNGATMSITERADQPTNDE